MKKLLLSAALVVTSLSASAQLADGSVAPDFTITDQFGNSHTLSDYTNAGKTVILDLFAVWCGPCWNYHNTHAMKDLYQAYGPNGSDEVMVFSIEVDGSTAAADLGGGGQSVGDWLEGTPYPMADDASLAGPYALAYYPTIYRICPNGLVYEEGQSSISQLIASIGNNCGQTLSGANDHVEMHDGAAALCSTDGVPTFEFENYGTNNVTSGTVILKENGAQVASTNFSGSVSQFNNGTVTFPSMALNPANTYTAEMTDVNGNAAFNGTPDMANTVWNGSVGTMAVTQAALSGVDIAVDFFTDNYPGETSWEIRNSGGAVVVSGGPYTPGTDDSFGAGGPDAQTTMSSTHTLPVADECYSVRLLDSYGDGQQYGTGTNPQGGFGIEIKSFGNVLFNWDAGTFGTQADQDAALRTEVNAISEVEIKGLNIYPNPASDVLNVAFEATEGGYSVSILDLSGREIATQSYNTAGSANVAFPVSNLSTGSYLVTVTTAAGTHTENVVIK